MKETNFKHTDIGDIPHDWNVKTVAQITDIVTGATPSTANSTYWENGDIPWMSSGELNKKIIYQVDGRITQKGYDNSGTHMIPKHCVLIGLAGQGKTRGTAAYNEIELCTNQSIAAILPNKGVLDSRYLYYQTDSKYDFLRLMSAGDGGRGGLNKQILLGLSFPFPPSIAEQQRIATALSQMDELISALDEQINKKLLIKQAAMQQLLTAKTRLNGFSEPWVEKKLGEVADVIMGQSPSSDSYNTLGVGLPLIQGNADIKNRKSIINVYTSQYNKTCEINDIIMSVRAPVGAIGKASYKSCLGRGVCAIKSHSEFLYHYLIFIEKDWSKLSSGSTFDSINGDILRNRITFVPSSLPEQQAIASILTAMDNEIQALQAQRDKYTLIKQGMMQQLLTGKIRI